MRSRQVLLAVLLTTCFAAAGCGGNDERTAPAPASAAPVGTAGTTEAAQATRAGGVYRVGVESSFYFTDGFDPTGEYIASAFAIYSNLLVRTLVGYNHIAGARGTKLVPDLATDLGDVSPDGRAYTFRLKDGVRFGPPVSREITSRDVKFAFERIGTPSLVAQYGFYYDVIEGMATFRDGKASDIAGIQTPDDKTVVFRLTQPAGDFLYRLAMPAAGPMPEEVADCFTEAGEYGRFVVASGPYMIEGSEKQDISSCGALEPLSGYEPDTKLILVRNPDYDPATDTPEARESLPDRFEFLVNSNNDDIFDQIGAGVLEGEFASPPSQVLSEYSKSPELKGRLFSNAQDGIWYLTMNLTQPPFDDVHVRRAINLVVDKGALQRVLGGPLQGSIARHVIPDSMLNGLLDDYDPYPSPQDAGDVMAAKAEMRQSHYDTDADGFCDAQECRNVLHIAGTWQTNVKMIPILEASLAKIGITLKSRTIEDAISVIQTVAKNVPFSSAPGWSKDYPDAGVFMVLFDSRNIGPTGNPNHSLVGLTAEQAVGLDGIQGRFEGIPSIDADIDNCTVLSGEERIRCWAVVDRKLMEDVVPWVPYLAVNEVDIIGPAVTKYEYDQFTGEAALAHVAVDASRQ